MIKQADTLGCSGKPNRIQGERDSHIKYPFSKIFLISQCRKKWRWTFATIKYQVDSDYLNPSILNAKGVPKKGHTCTDLVCCTETGYGRNIKLQSFPPTIFHLLQPLTLKWTTWDQCDQKGNSDKRVYKKQLAGFLIEYCILHICWLFILRFFLYVHISTHTYIHTCTHIHTHISMYARKTTITRVRRSLLTLL